MKQICKKKQNRNTIRILWYPAFKANSDVRVFDLAVGEGVVWALSLNSRIYRLHSLSPHLTTGNFWTQIDHKLIAISVDSTTDNRLWGLDTENRIVRHEVITHHLNWKILFYDVMGIIPYRDIFLNKSSNSYLFLQRLFADERLSRQKFNRKWCSELLLLTSRPKLMKLISNECCSYTLTYHTRLLECVFTAKLRIPLKLSMWTARIMRSMH